MTNLSPKDKAKRLVEYYSSILADFKQSGGHRQKGYAKMIAGQVCNEIIEFMQDAVTIVCEDGGEILEPRQYWSKVKSEIEKL